MDRQVIIGKVVARLKKSLKKLDDKLEKKFKVEDVSVKITQEALPGSREFPAEPAEYEIEEASLVIPDLTKDEAEMLPTEFEVTKPYRLDEEDLDVEITFKVKIKNRKILPNGKVEVEYDDKVVD